MSGRGESPRPFVVTGKGCVRRYLFASLRGNCKDFIKNRARRQPSGGSAAVLATVPSSDDVAGAAELGLVRKFLEVELLREGLSQLSAPEQEAVQLIIVDGLKFREAASKAGSYKSTIEDRYNRAVAKLKKFLERELG